MTRKRYVVGAAAVIAFTTPSLVSADVVLIDQFAPGLGQLVSCGFNPVGERVWVYDGFGSVLSSYDTLGVFVSSVPRPGEAANDVDIEFAHEGFTLGSTPVPAGALIFINGESGAADVYAVDTTTGAVLATLTTSFGISHVVGGAYHHGRGTLFLVQDKVPGGAAANRVAEIDPATGAVLNSFQTTAFYSVNFGDLEVSVATGNLYLVSSDHTTIAEVTPTGRLVQELPLPAGVGALSGIGIDDATGEAWVSGTNGAVWHIGGLPQIIFGDITRDGVVDIDDLFEVIGQWGDCSDPPAKCTADVDDNGVVDIDDLFTVIANWT